MWFPSCLGIHRSLDIKSYTNTNVWKKKTKPYISKKLICCQGVCHVTVQVFLKQTTATCKA